MFASNKHSSLLLKTVAYAKKSFLPLDPKRYVHVYLFLKRVINIRFFSHFISLSLSLFAGFPKKRKKKDVFLFVLIEMESTPIKRKLKGRKKKY
jgi:hypothetical protein